MILRFLLLLLPFSLFASELVWDGKISSLSESEQKKAVKEYVDEHYPKKVAAFVVYERERKARLEREKKARLERERKARLERERITRLKRKTRLERENTVTIGNLMWQDNEDAKTIKRTWQGAKDYCRDLELVGYTDWRLPSVEELQSIVDKGRSPAIKKEFKNVASDYYWSSSPNVTYSEYACGVSFLYGDSLCSSKTNNSYVRCARAGQ